MEQQTPSRCTIDVKKMLRSLAMIFAPIVVMQMVVLIFAHPSLSKEASIGALEMYAGQHEVTKAFWSDAVVSYPMDLEIDKTTMDILSDAGLAVLYASIRGCRTYIFDTMYFMFFKQPVRISPDQVSF